MSGEHARKLDGTAEFSLQKTRESAMHLCMSHTENEFQQIHKNSQYVRIGPKYVRHLYSES